MRNFIIRFIVTLLGMLPAEMIFSQQHNHNNLLEWCALFSPYQLNVDEFLRYEIPDTSSIIFPDVHMETVWGCPLINPLNKPAILQVGIAAPKIIDQHIPVNVSIVIDRSASMQQYHRMEKVKVALKELFKLLQPDDYASIVVYDNNASVLLNAQRRDNYSYEYVANLIDGISPGSNTNMVSGMLLGYKEVLKYYNPYHANRVILLTDGITNLGITDPKAIIEQSRFYNRKGIDISTIGVGADINFKLLSDIATEGRGLSHFIGDCDSVRNEAIKVFREELNDMSALIKNAVIEIIFPKQFTATALNDDTNTRSKKTISLPVGNLHQGYYHGYLFEFTPVSKINKEVEFTIRLKYYDVLARENKTISKKKILQFSGHTKINTDILKNINVRNNYHTLLMAMQLKKAVNEYSLKRYNQAYKTLNQCLTKVEGKIELTNASLPQYPIYHLMLRQKKAIRLIMNNK